MKKLTIFVLAVIAVLLAVFMACSKSPSGPGGKVDEKIEQTENGIKQTIAPAKETEVVLQDEISVSIPADAISAQDNPNGATVTLERLTPESTEDTGAIAVDVQPLSPVYHIDAGDVNFKKPVTVRIPLSNIAKPDEINASDLQIVTWSDESLDYEFLDTSLSSDNTNLEAELTHFSYFAAKLKKGTEFYGKLDLSLHIDREGDKLVFDNLYSNIEMNDWAAFDLARRVNNGLPFSKWINYQVEVFKDGFLSNDALATMQIYRVVWYSQKKYYGEWKETFNVRAGDLYGKCGYALKRKDMNKSDAIVGLEKIIVYNEFENPTSNEENSYTFTADNPFDKFLYVVFFTEESKRFCPVSVFGDPNGKYFIKVSRVYQDGQIGGSNTATTSTFTPYDIPPAVTLSAPANYAKVKTLTPEFKWDGSSAADVATNYEIRLSARNNDPVKTPEITKPVGSVELFSNATGQIKLEQLPYYWCVRAFTVKDGKQVAEAFSEVRSFEVVGPDFYTVSGKVLENGKGLAGVTVTLKGVDPEMTATTASDGSYYFQRVYGGTYTVSAALAGYTITQPAKPISVYADATVPDITAVKIPKIISISGVIKENNTGLSGVNVTLSGGDGKKTLTTVSDGKYSFTNLYDGTYTVTPGKSEYSFSPPSKTFPNAATNQTQDFVGYKLAVELLRIEKDPSVTGQFWFYATTYGIPDIQEVQFFIDSGNAMNMIDMGGGMWRIPIKTSSLGEGAHTAKARAINKELNSIGEHTMKFTRSGDTLSVGSTTAPTTYTLTGRVLLNGSGLLGVSVHLTGAGKDTTATTLSTGSYTFTALPNGTYTLAPSKSGYSFTPANPTATVSNANASTVDITATVSTTPIPHETKGITFVSISGGTFQMGDVEGAGDSDEKPVHSVTVSDFEMGIYEVTNTQYCAYLNAALASGDIELKSGDVYGKTGSWSGKLYLDIGYSYNTNNKCWITNSGSTFSVTAGKENWPVVAVTWYGSKAFATYYGLDLPTEAEWEYACRGGRQYKYGTDDGTISSTKVNYNSNVGYPKDVGSYPRNPYGLFDMSGNVWEWCHDIYWSYTSASQNNPSGAQTGSYRVGRGGGWYNGDYICRSANRDIGFPDAGGGNLGFRVVRRLSPQNY